MKLSRSPFADAHPPIIHFIAISGVAMASVATELDRAGFHVTGSDTGFYPPMGTLLKDQGVKTFQGFAPEHLPDSGLVVVGNAVSRGNVELEAALDRGLPVISLPELITRRYLTTDFTDPEHFHSHSRRNIIVAGTHGKTTTTTMLAHILRFAGRDPGWLIGGLPKDLPVPCFKGAGREFVIEGDEYDAVFWDKRPKFLHYRPYWVILNSIEFDHADIYADLDEIKLQFKRLIGLIPDSGGLIALGDNALVRELAGAARCQVTYFGTDPDNDWQLDPTTITVQEQTRAVVRNPQQKKIELNLNLTGTHNLLNGLAALAAAEAAGIPVSESLAALAGFHGVARRLELVVTSPTLTIYDDFAHHPTAIELTLQAIRRQYPSSVIWAIIEPRSNTMVKNIFQREISEAVAVADQIIFGKLHREERIPTDQRLNLNQIQTSLERQGKQCFLAQNVSEIIGYIQAELTGNDVLVIMSNGSFDGLSGRLKELIS